MFTLNKPILTLDGVSDLLALELGSPQYYYRKEIEGGTLHEILLPSLDKFLKEIGVSLKNLDGLAINSGPGNYNRLRVSLTWAKTTALLLKIPLINYDSFALIDAYLNRVSQKLKDGFLKGDTIGKNSSYKDQLNRIAIPLRIYVYRVSQHRYFSCIYWKKVRVSEIIALNQFPQKKWLNIKEDINEAKGEILKELERSDQFFLIDGNHAHSFEKISHDQTVISINKLIKEFKKSDFDKEKIDLKPSLFYCLRETIKDNASQKFDSNPLSVNPHYCREFGE